MARAESTAVVVFDATAEPLSTNTDPSPRRSLIEAGQDDGEPHQVPDRPAMTVIRLDLVGIGLSVIGTASGPGARRRW